MNSLKMKPVAAFFAITIASIATAKAGPVEQAVIVHFQYGSTDLARLFTLEGHLEKAIAGAKAGDYDGNEIREDGADGYLYMYGPNADRLFDAVMPVLKETDFMGDATVKRRYGPPKDGTREITVTISGSKP